MPIFNRNLAFGALVLGALASASCKVPDPENKSGAQSVDNMASAVFKFNDCRQTGRAAFAPPADRITAGEFFADIKVALENIPEGLRSAFFAEPIRGRIALVSSVADVCPAASSGSGDQALSCIKSNGESGPLTIYIKQEAEPANTKRNIYHSMTRAFGYVLAEAIAPNLPNSDAAVQVAEEFAVRLLADVAEKEGQNGYSLSMFSSFLPATVLKVGMSEEERRRIFAALPSASKQKFREAVLAETFDSLNCSDRTLMVFERDFKRLSGTHYASLDDGRGSTLEDYVRVMLAQDAINQISGGLADGLAGGVQPADGGGLGLWGRWGPGNGPLRQGLTNWGNHRASGGGLMNFRRFQNGGGLIFRRPWFNPARWGTGAR